jgi:hypothetical protein
MKAGFAERPSHRSNQRQQQDIFDDFQGFDPFRGFGDFGGASFAGFRNPQDIFEEFFGTKNIFDAFGAVSNNNNNNKKFKNSNNLDINFNDMFANPTNSGFTNVSKSTSKSTKIVNGKKITTIK